MRTTKMLCYKSYSTITIIANHKCTFQTEQFRRFIKNISIQFRGGAFFSFASPCRSYLLVVRIVHYGMFFSALLSICRDSFFSLCAIVCVLVLFTLSWFVVLSSFCSLNDSECSAIKLHYVEFMCECEC